MATTPSENHTSISLLDRIRLARREGDWRIFVDVYDGLILRWLQRAGVHADDMDDLKQEILLTLVRAIPTFQHNGHVGAFRKWLKSLVTHRVLHHFRQANQRQRATNLISEHEYLSAVEDRMLTDSWEREHDEHVLQALLNVVEHQFTSTTWTAFRRQFFDRLSAESVAQELGISENAVLIAKSRVLRRLREEAAGILD